MTDPFSIFALPQNYVPTTFRWFFEYKKNCRLVNVSHFHCYVPTNKAFYCYLGCFLFLFDYCYSDYCFSSYPLLHKPWLATAGAVQVILSCQLW